jgi:hypothetical protein
MMFFWRLTFLSVMETWYVCCTVVEVAEEDEEVVPFVEGTLPMDGIPPSCWMDALWRQVRTTTYASSILNPMTLHFQTTNL